MRDNSKGRVIPLISHGLSAWFDQGTLIYLFVGCLGLGLKDRAEVEVGELADNLSALYILNKLTARSLYHQER